MTKWWHVFFLVSVLLVMYFFVRLIYGLTVLLG